MSQGHKSQSGNTTILGDIISKIIHVVIKIVLWLIITAAKIIHVLLGKIIEFIEERLKN